MANQDINAELLNIINRQYINPQLLRDILQEYLDKFLTDLGEKNTPQEGIASFGGTLGNPWVVDYKNRRHIFLFNPTAAPINITSTDSLYNLAVQPGWNNVSFPQSTKLNTATAVQMPFKCTDEQVP